MLHKNLLFYLVVVSIFGLLVWLIIIQGRQLELPQPALPPAGESAQANSSVLNDFVALLTHNLSHPLSLLLLQIAVIVLVARLFGLIFSKMGQPLVIGEMIAGIVLGPSVIGAWWPQLSSFLFQPESLGRLETLSNLGLILFMFIIGLELEAGLLKNKAHAAVVVSHASIVFPFFLGVGLAYFLYTGFAPAQVPFVAFSLFMGIAMSVTAFPVLARIIQERGLTQSPLGVLALTCAAADDVTAWCLLAAVVAIIQAGTVMTAFFTMLLALLYVLAMLYLVRPLLQRLGGQHAAPGKVNKGFIALLFIILFLSAFATSYWHSCSVWSLFGRRNYATADRIQAVVYHSP
jgi:Kef-type K+ transport system membrane component KefB